MFSSGKTREMASQVAALNRSQAIIEFDLKGLVLTANKNFLDAVGYQLDEIVGKHHSIFVADSEKASAEYREFWASLNRGEYQAAQYCRVAKGGREIWIQASYNPIMDAKGEPYKVIKFATDITNQKNRDLELDGKIAALSRSQAVIEFQMDGTIITANENFLKVMEYSLSDIQGRNHSMFMPDSQRDTAAYRKFWDDLRAGQFIAAEFKRMGRDGKEVWIIACYSPIFDSKGIPFKVVKIATDVTKDKLRTADDAAQIAAINKSQAVIEFTMEGIIAKANDHFLQTMGYSFDEIVGRHHRMCVDPAERDGREFAEFWAKLNQGIYQASEYKRLGKGGREVWIQASYNPIFDLNGKPYKVVKYASDITKQVMARVKAERARSMIQSVAAGSEEMSASIREISETMGKSRQTTDTAMHRVSEADGQAKRLSDAASSMGGIVQMIAEITGQINLLALNATIESARAGEAGRGFAVVASEVKNLANQARAATDKITKEISDLSAISGDVVQTFAAIKNAFEDVNEFVTSTAAAVEEQSAVIDDMSNNMQQAVAELA